MGIEGVRFEVVHEVPCISTEGASADFFLKKWWLG